MVLSGVFVGFFSLFTLVTIKIIFCFQKSKNWTCSTGKGESPLLASFHLAACHYECGLWCRRVQGVSSSLKRSEPESGPCNSARGPALPQRHLELCVHRPDPEESNPGSENCTDSGVTVHRW